MEKTQINWNLDRIYPGFDSPEYARDFETLKPSVEAINDLAAKLTTFADLAKLIELYSAYNITFGRLWSYGSYVFSTNTASEDSAKSQYLLRTINAETSRADVRITAFVAKMAAENDLDALIKQHGLEDYHYFITKQVAKSHHQMSEDEETLTSNLTTTGSSAWEKLQDTLVANLTCDYTDPATGETRTIGIGECRNLAYDPCHKVRKAAYEAEIAAYPKIAESSAAALNAIKGEVNLLSGLRKHESPLAETLFKQSMTQKTLDAMFTAIDENIQIFRNYMKTKAAYLNKTNGTNYTSLPFYEMFAPVGGPIDGEATMSYAEAQKYVLDNFGKFSPAMKQLAEDAFAGDWIDVYPRDGKVSGAFCGSVRSLKESRILLNHGDSISDATTLAHELGHAYHNVQLFKGSIINSYQVPMPLAETASNFCELIVKNATLSDENIDEGTKLQIVESSLQDATQVMIDIYSRFLFEKSVFEARKAQPLSVNQLKELMLDAQRKTYGDGMDENAMHPFMWAIKPHYYSAGRSYYNFPYAFGALFSIGLYKIYQTNPAAFHEKYDRFLLATGEAPIKDSCAMMGIDVESPDFWRGALDIIKEDLVKFEAAV